MTDISMTTYKDGLVYEDAELLIELIERKTRISSGITPSWLTFTFEHALKLKVMLAHIAHLITPCNKKCSKEAGFVEASDNSLPNDAIVLVQMIHECLT